MTDGHLKLNGEYKTGSKAHQVWSSMMRRVYRPSTACHERVYGNVEIESSWHDFQTFAAWYYEQINRFENSDISWDVDKDLLVPGNKIYSPNMCCVIPHQVNSLFISGRLRRGKYPLGVSRQNLRFKAQVNESGRLKYLGLYGTVREAQLAYWNAKFDAIRNTTILFWNYIPETLALRLIEFGWEDAIAYYGDDALLWSNNEGVK